MNPIVDHPNATVATLVGAACTVVFLLLAQFGIHVNHQQELAAAITTVAVGIALILPGKKKRANAAHHRASRRG